MVSKLIAEAVHLKNKFGIDSPELKEFIEKNKQFPMLIDFINKKSCGCSKEEPKIRLL